MSEELIALRGSLYEPSYDIDGNNTSEKGILYLRYVCYMEFVGILSVLNGQIMSACNYGKVLCTFYIMRYMYIICIYMHL